ncbi:hypothetical protein [Nocardia higoensis]|uniref:hypothetical protein n=1 Tax=Nocardia higoensis TaxID=228599 RepID=UPI000593AAFB|nr:hypothetical protein [Nocardia higoensis]
MNASRPELPRSLSELRALFAGLPVGAAPVTGTYRAEFVGPGPLRVAAPRAIALGGMRRWHGKRFAGDGTAVNVLRAPGDGAGLVEHLPMTVATESSWLDGQPAIVVSYGGSGPIPWRWVRDEFRVLDENTLLGLTFVGGPWSRVAAAPFLLIRED